MPVQLYCPSCKAGLRLDEKLLGKKVQCGKCKNIFLAAVDPPAPANETPAAAAPEPITLAPTEPAGTAIETGSEPVAPPRSKSPSPPPVPSGPARADAKTRPAQRTRGK